MDVAQSELLALLLEEGLPSQQQTAALSRPQPDGLGMVTWQSHDLVAEQQQPIPVEGGAVVGCQRERMEPTKELISNQPTPLSFLNANMPDTNTLSTCSVDLGNSNLFDSIMLDTILGSSTMEVVGASTNTVTTPSSTTSSPSPSFPLVPGGEVTTFDGATTLVDDFFEDDLDKLLHPFAESILNPVGGAFDAWDIESMLTAS